MPVVRLQPMIPAGAAPETGIGERIKYARSELSLSVDALARLTKRYDQFGEEKGISPTSITRYESGESLPGARELRLLCEAFDVPVQWLLLGQLPNSGRNAVEQQLLEALTRFAQQPTLQEPHIAATLQGLRAQERARRYAEARKTPGSS